MMYRVPHHYYHHGTGTYEVRSERPRAPHTQPTYHQLPLNAVIGEQTGQCVQVVCQDCAVWTRDFCAVLSDDDLGRLEQRHTTVKLDSEESLFMEGDDAGSCFTVLPGSMR